MDKLIFEVAINAPVERVCQIMLDDKHYRIWTAPFCDGSHYQGSWEKGSKILFLAPDQNGNLGGMVSRIAEHIPNKFISILHLGVVHSEKEITSGPEAEGWSNAYENYTFENKGRTTLLRVELDSKEEFKEMFDGIWPKALAELKNICEK